MPQSALRVRILLPTSSPQLHPLRDVSASQGTCLGPQSRGTCIHSPMTLPLGRDTGRYVAKSSHCTARMPQTGASRPLPFSTSGNQAQISPPVRSTPEAATNVHQPRAIPSSTPGAHLRAHCPGAEAGLSSMGLAPPVSLHGPDAAPAQQRARP